MHSPIMTSRTRVLSLSKVNVTLKNLNGYKTSHIFTN